MTEEGGNISDGRDAVKSEKLDDLCRLCANAETELMPIFEGEGLENNLPVKISLYLPIIKVTHDDRLPIHVCYQCASSIIAWHNLYEGCKVADVRLRRILGDDQIPKAVEYEEITHYETFDYDDDDDHDDADFDNDPGSPENEYLDHIIQLSPSGGAGVREENDDTGAVSEIIAPEEVIQLENQIVIDNEETSVVVGPEVMELDNLTEEQCFNTAEEGDPLRKILENEDGNDVELANTRVSDKRKLRSANKKNNSEYKCVYCMAVFTDCHELDIHHATHSFESDESECDIDDKSDTSYKACKRRRTVKNVKYSSRLKSRRANNKQYTEVELSEYTEPDACNSKIENKSDMIYHKQKKDVAKQSEFRIKIKPIMGDINVNNENKSKKLEWTQRKRLKDKQETNSRKKFTKQRDMSEKKGSLKLSLKIKSDKLISKNTSDSNELKNCVKKEVLHDSNSARTDLKKLVRSYVEKPDKDATYIEKADKDAIPLVANIKKNDYTFQCGYCLRTYTRKHRLAYHIITLHMDNVTDEASKCNYKCSKCNKEFYWKSSLLIHMRNHLKNSADDDADIYECNTCHSKFDKKYLLSRHLKRKNGCSLKYECDKCDRKFRSHYEYSRHMKSTKIHGDTFESYTCGYCERDFHQKTGLEKHMVLVHIQKNNYTSAFKRGYCCEICHSAFHVSTDLLRHRKIIHDAKEITWTGYTHSVNLISLCGICKKYFKRGTFDNHNCQKDAELHEDVKTLIPEDTDKSFFCDVCGLRYAWKCELRLHRENIHPNASTWNKFLKIVNPVASCSKCDKAFSSESSLESHKCDPDRSCDDSCDLLSRYACTTCGRCFLSKENYTRHLFEQHVQVALSNEEEVNKLTSKAHRKKRVIIPIDCMYCDKVFYTRKEIINHIKEEHGVETESPFACKVCMKIYRRQQSLIIHNKLYHPDNNNEDENKKILEAAMVIINGEPAYHCNLCSRNIFVKQEFLAHYRFHNLEKEFTCEQCGWQTRTKHQLNKHIKIVHLNVRDYVCDLCGKNFNRKQTRDEHRRIHTGERPFSCEVCGNTFIAMNNLISHRKFHNDYYPHTCNICPKKFKLRRSLINHIRVHTGERPYKCEICSKTYNNSSRYNYHMKVTHSDNRPFFCSICGSCFKTNKFLKRHLKLHSVRTHIQVRRRNNPVLYNKLHNITDDQASAPLPKRSKSSNSAKKVSSTVKTASNSKEEIPPVLKITDQEYTLPTYSSTGQTMENDMQGGRINVRSSNIGNNMQSGIINERASNIGNNMPGVIINERASNIGNNMQSGIINERTSNVGNNMQSGIINERTSNVGNTMQSGIINERVSSNRDSFVGRIDNSECHQSSSILDCTNKSTEYTNKSYTPSDIRHSMDSYRSSNDHPVKMYSIPENRADKHDDRNSSIENRIPSEVLRNPILPRNDIIMKNSNPMDNRSFNENGKTVLPRNPNEYLIRAYFVPDGHNAYGEARDLSSRDINNYLNRMCCYNESGHSEGVRDQMSKDINNYVARIYNAAEGRHSSESADGVRKHLFNLILKTVPDPIVDSFEIRTSKDRPYYCNICGFTFKRLDHVKSHKKWVHDRVRDRNFECNHCGKLLKTVSGMSQHMYRHKGEKPFVCEFCDKRFYSNCYLLKHYQSHLEQSAAGGFIPCPKCTNKYTSEEELKFHLMWHDMTQICNVCDKKFETKKQLFCHMRRHNDHKPFKCNDCGETFQLMKSLVAHKKKHLLTGQKKLTPSRKPVARLHRCDICHLTYKNEVTYNKHRKEHFDNRSFYCKFCNLNYVTEVTFKHHMKRHERVIGNLPLEPVLDDNLEEGEISNDNEDEDGNKYVIICSPGDGMKQGSHEHDSRQKGKLRGEDCIVYETYFSTEMVDDPDENCKNFDKGES